MSDQGFKVLRVMVTAMGIFLMLGIIALFYFVYERNQSLKNTGDACPGGNIEIAKGHIRAIQAEKGLLFLTVDFAAGGEKVMVFDYCKGKVLSMVKAVK